MNEPTNSPHVLIIRYADGTFSTYVGADVTLTILDEATATDTPQATNDWWCEEATLNGRRFRVVEVAPGAEDSIVPLNERLRESGRLAAQHLQAMSLIATEDSLD